MWDTDPTEVSDWTEKIMHSSQKQWAHLGSGCQKEVMLLCTTYVACSLVCLNLEPQLKLPEPQAKVLPEPHWHVWFKILLVPRRHYQAVINSSDTRAQFYPQSCFYWASLRSTWRALKEHRTHTLPSVSVLFVTFQAFCHTFYTHCQGTTSTTFKKRSQRSVEVLY